MYCAQGKLNLGKKKTFLQGKLRKKKQQPGSDWENKSCYTSQVREVVEGFVTLQQLTTEDTKEKENKESMKIPLILTIRK